MKQLLFLLTVVFAIYSAPVNSQDDTNGWGKNSTYNRMYDPKTVVEIEGRILAVERIAPMSGMGPGIHVTIDTGNESISAHLGPAWYIESHNFSLQKGDKIEVEGSKVMFDSQHVIIARKLEFEDRELVLRDNNGIPQWSRSRKKQKN